MKKKILNIVLLIVACVACSNIRLFVVDAAEQKQSMHVSPPNQRVVLVPGEKYSDSIMIYNANDSTRALKYELSIGSFSQKSGEEGKDDYEIVDHINVSTYNQMMDWITLDKTSGTVEPNEKDIVKYTIDVPEDVPAGGQYATIIVKDVTDKDIEKKGNVAVDSTFQFASIIYAEVAGDTKMEGVITDNSIPSFLLNGPLEAVSMVENKGNVHTDAEYTLQVWPLFGDEEICTNEEKPETSLILPGTERYHAQSCDLPSVGIFRAKQIVKIFGETSIVERMVIICPLWLLFLILFAIIAIVIWIVMKIRGNKKRSRNSSDD